MHQATGHQSRYYRKSVLSAIGHAQGQYKNIVRTGGKGQGRRSKDKPNKDTVVQKSMFCGLAKYKFQNLFVP